MYTNDMFINYAKRFVLYVFISAMGGCLMGGFMAGLSFPAAKSTMEFGMSFGFPVGSFFGLLFGVLSFWPLRKEDMVNIFITLAIFSFALGVVAFIVCIFTNSGEYAPVYCWFSSVIGYWIGVVVVGLENPFKGKKKTEGAVLSKRDDGELRL